MRQVVVLLPDREWGLLFNSYARNMYIQIQGYDYQLLTVNRKSDGNWFIITDEQYYHFLRGKAP